MGKQETSHFVVNMHINLSLSRCIFVVSMELYVNRTTKMRARKMAAKGSCT